MIKAWIYVCARRTHRAGTRIEKVCIQACGCGVLIARRAAEHQNLPTRKQHRIHFNAGLRHGGGILPQRSAGRKVDNLRRIGRRIGASEDHHARLVIVRWRQG